MSYTICSCPSHVLRTVSHKMEYCVIVFHVYQMAILSFADYLIKLIGNIVPSVL